MRHIHTSIVSKHLATRGNNKIRYTPQPHISRSEELLPRLTRRTLAQLKTNKSSYRKSYLRKVDVKSHPSPIFPLRNTRNASSHQQHPHTHHIFTLGVVDRPRRSGCTDGQMDGEAGSWTTWECVDNNRDLAPQRRLLRPILGTWPMMLRQGV